MNEIAAEYSEDEVVKDAAYFDELRRAVKGTPPIALFGTSGLAVHKSIECAQDLELRKQVESAADPDMRERLRTVYSSYHFYTTALSYFTEALPWLTALTILIVISSAIKTLPKPTTERYTVIAAFLVISAAIFMATKILQVILWRVGSYVIRSWTYARLETINVASAPDDREAS